MTTTTAERVPALIEQLSEYPDERAEITFEIADELRRSGDVAAALGWLRTLTDEDGFDGALAHVQIAEIHFEAGQDDLAAAELDEIRGEREPDAYAAAAALLAERGDDTAALRWYTMAASRFADEQHEAARGESGWLAPAYLVLWQRHLLRERLGYPPDDLQDGLWEPPARRGRDAFPSTQQVLADPKIGSAKHIRVLTWPMAEFARAKELWPRLLDAATSHEEYRGRLESQLREHTERGRARITLVPARVDALQEYAQRTGGCFEDAATRHGYLIEQHQQGNVVAWPPRRNEPCWCGTAVKYKKCCGRVAA